jgi:hypothetical protein
MKKNKPMSDFSWPFARRRQTWIDEADRLSEDAGDLYEQALFKAAEHDKSRSAKKAANHYEHAGEYYQRAGLGLAARNSFLTAAECWSLIGDERACERCEHAADQIRTYWEDEENHESEGE